MKEKVQTFDYSPTLYLSYEQNLDTKEFTQPVIEVKIRETDEEIFKNVLTSLGKLGNLDISLIKIFTIPEGKECV